MMVSCSWNLWLWCVNPLVKARQSWWDPDTMAEETMLTMLSHGSWWIHQNIPLTWLLTEPTNKVEYRISHAMLPINHAKGKELGIQYQYACQFFCCIRHKRLPHREAKKCQVRITFSVLLPFELLVHWYYPMSSAWNSARHDSTYCKLDIGIP